MKKISTFGKNIVKPDQSTPPWIDLLPGGTEKQLLDVGVVYPV